MVELIILWLKNDFMIFLKFLFCVTFIASGNLLVLLMLQMCVSAQQQQSWTSNIFVLWNIFASYPHDAHSQQILWCQYLHTECILDSNSKGMWLPAFWYQEPTFSMEEKQNHKIPLLFHYTILGIWRTNGISFYKKLPQFVMNPLMKVKEFLLKLPYKAS